MAAPGRLRATAFTHQGAARARNEDTIAVADWIASESMAGPVVLEHALAQPVVCLVADGMGGHAAGDVASRSVAERLARRAAEATDEAALGAAAARGQRRAVRADGSASGLVRHGHDGRGRGGRAVGRGGVQCRRQPGLPDRGRRLGPAQHRRHAGTQAARRPHRGLHQLDHHPGRWAATAPMPARSRSHPMS